MADHLSPNPGLCPAVQPAPCYARLLFTCALTDKSLGVWGHYWKMIACPALVAFSLMENEDIMLIIGGPNLVQG